MRDVLRTLAHFKYISCFLAGIHFWKLGQLQIYHALNAYATFGKFVEKFQTIAVRHAILPSLVLLPLRLCIILGALHKHEEIKIRVKLDNKVIGS